MRFGINETVFKMTVPISRPGKGLDIQKEHEISLAYKICTSAEI